MSFSGGSGGGFTKRGGTNEGTFVAIPPYKAKWGNDVFQVRIDGEALELAIGAGSLCDAVSTALLLHHTRMITAGRVPSGGAQRRLDPDAQQGRRAAKGQRPNVRGFTGNAESFPNILTRSAISLSKGEVRIGGTERASGPRQKGKRGPTSPKMGFSASATINPGKGLQAKWLQEEFGLGVEYFAVVGASDRVVTEAVADYLATVTNGPRSYEKRRFQARDV